MMKRKLSFFAVMIFFVFLLGGCSLIGGMSDKNDDELPLTNGTTIGNILNGGFAVKYGESLIVYYTGQSTYDYGSVLTSDPDTGENSLILKDGGLYMNVVGDSLYYCREDGVYAASLETFETMRILDRDVSQLQIADGAMYFIEDGRIDSTLADGSERAFSAIGDAAWLNVYDGSLYYVDTKTGYICTAGLDGSDAGVLFETSADMLLVVDDVIYYTDRTDGHIKCMLLAGGENETVTAYPCSGFNVNRNGIYYTRNVDGQSLCCNTGADGYQENVIADLGESAWHRVCMWGDTAIVVSEEEIAALQ